MVPSVLEWCVHMASSAATRSRAANSASSRPSLSPATAKNDNGTMLYSISALRPDELLRTGPQEKLLGNFVHVAIKCDAVIEILGSSQLCFARPHGNGGEDFVV